MCCCTPFGGNIPPMSLQNPKFPSKLKSTEMADETELFYTPVSKVVLFATLLVSVSDLHKGLSSFVFPVKQITQNPLVATPYGFDPHHRHQSYLSGFYRLGTFYFVPPGRHKPEMSAALSAYIFCIGLSLYGIL